MRFLKIVTIGATASALCFAIGVNAQGQQGSAADVQMPASQVQFVPSGIKQNGGEVFLGPAYGDIKNGKHGTFLKFTRGFHSLLHSHTYDYYAVVIKGTMSNPVNGGKGLPLPPGSYWYQKGGEPHATNCLSKKEDCVIFLVSDGKFDSQVLEKEAP